MVMVGGAVHGGGVPLLAKVTSVLTKVLQRDAELRLSDFNGRPYYRILLGLIQELSPADVSEEGAFGTLSTLASALLNVQPLQVPGFSFPWLELISHRQGPRKAEVAQEAQLPIVTFLSNGCF